MDNQIHQTRRPVGVVALSALSLENENSHVCGQLDTRPLLPLVKVRESSQPVV